MVENTAIANSFVDSGVPVLGRIWSGSDYLAAYQALTEEDSELPMLSEPDGAAVLRSITSQKNLEPLLDAEVPMDVRLVSGQKMAEATLKLLVVYETQKRREDTGHSEAALISSFALRLNGVSVEINAGNPEEADLNAQQERFRSGLAVSLNGATMQLYGSPLYTDEAIVELLHAIEDVSRASASLLDANSKERLVRSLERAKVVIPEKHHQLHGRVLRVLRESD